MSDTRDLFVARQPVLDRQHRIVGYEFLFRSAEAAGDKLDDGEAAVKGLTDSIEAVGVEKLLGSTMGFLNVTPEFIMDDVLAVLPSSQIVLQIPQMEAVYPEFIRRCRDLKKEGIRFALRDFERRDTRDDLLEVARYIKIDFENLKPSDLKQLIRKIKRTNAMLLASSVSTQAAAQEYQKNGSDFFQGYYFAEPVIVEGKKVDPDRAALMDVLMKIGKGCDFDKIVEVFKRNAGLTVNLLRLVNSGSFARATKIKSVSEALVLIGSLQLVRWLTLLLYAGDGQTGMSDSLMKIAAKRGRTLETLFKELPDAGGASGEVAFLAGMLSLMDVLFSVSIPEVLEQIAVDEDVQDILLHRKGPLGALLRIEEMMETGDIAGASTVLAELELSPDRLTLAHHEAFAWIHGRETPGL